MYRLFVPDFHQTEFFIHGGGKQYEYIPALNDKVEHIDLLEAIIRDICEK